MGGTDHKVGDFIWFKCDPLGVCEDTQGELIEFNPDTMPGKVKIKYGDQDEDGQSRTWKRWFPQSCIFSKCPKCAGKAPEWENGEFVLPECTLCDGTGKGNPPVTLWQSQSETDLLTGKTKRRPLINLECLDIKLLGRKRSDSPGLPGAVQKKPKTE